MTLLSQPTAQAKGANAGKRCVAVREGRVALGDLSCRRRCCYHSVGTACGLDWVVQKRPIP